MLKTAESQAPDVSDGVVRAERIFELLKLNVLRIVVVVVVGLAEEVEHVMQRSRRTAAMTPSGLVSAQSHATCFLQNLLTNYFAFTLYLNKKENNVNKTNLIR